MYHTPVALVLNTVLQRCWHNSPGKSCRNRLHFEFSDRNDPWLRYGASRGMQQGAFFPWENSFTTVNNQPDLTRSTGVRTGCPSRCRSCYCQPCKPAGGCTGQTIAWIRPLAPQASRSSRKEDFSYSSSTSSASPSKPIGAQSKQWRTTRKRSLRTET